MVKRLNLLVFLILSPEGKLLASYDIYREVHATKGFRRRGKQNVDRRVKALFLQGWLETKGTRETKPHFLSPLFKLSKKAIVALELRRDLNVFLETAPKDQLKEIIRAWGENPEEILSKDAYVRSNITQTIDDRQNHQLSILAEELKGIIRREVRV